MDKINIRTENKRLKPVSLANLIVKQLFIDGIYFLWLKETDIVNSVRNVQRDEII